MMCIHVTHLFICNPYMWLLQIIGLFCRIPSLLQGSFAKETCYFKEPTKRAELSVYIRTCDMYACDAFVLCMCMCMGWLRLVGSLKR